MTLRRTSIPGLVLLIVLPVWGQGSARDPDVGYLYPAGGQRGSTVLVAAGGQNLQSASEVFVSGRGVRARVIQFMRPMINLDQDERRLLQKTLVECRNARLAELSVEIPQARSERIPEVPEGVKMPEHPLLYELDSKSLAEIVHIVACFREAQVKRQLSRQLAAIVLLEVEIDADAPLGDRELRILTPAGLTNPMLFQVGTVPEVRELEPNDEEAHPDLSPWLRLEPGSLPLLPEQHVLDVPVVLNGQIMPGDADRFRFRARQHQKLVIAAQARHLIPYLADAVPGWFQATLTLYDAEGRELAFVDDHRFDPDPVMLFEVPYTGEYELEIRDAVFRGREDFVYRISVGEFPFVTSAFPLGAPVGKEAWIELEGWNLPEGRVALDTRASGPHVRTLSVQNAIGISQTIHYAVDDLPESLESEPNDLQAAAQPISLPMIINGRIGAPLDADVYRFEGRKGEVVAIEVHARRLDSPLDAFVRLLDASGKVVAWNDDFVEKVGHLHVDERGVVTHHADAILRAELPRKGNYFVEIGDVQGHGGAEYAYRLRVSRRTPDFELRVTPSSMILRPGAFTLITVTALRKDGFDGEIDLSLRAPIRGLALHGGKIPSGCTQIRATVTCVGQEIATPVELQLVGHAEIDGRDVRRVAVPAEQRMQAFLWQHLVPFRHLLVIVPKARRRTPTVHLSSSLPVHIPDGGSVELTYAISGNPRRNDLDALVLNLSQPPEGVRLRSVTPVDGGLCLELAIEEGAQPVGFRDNLIVEAYRTIIPRDQEGKPTGQKRVMFLTVLPAIPIEIVKE